MNKLTGNMKSSFDSNRNIIDPREERNCFRLIEQRPIRRESSELDHGEILANANYLFCDNESGQQIRLSGSELFNGFKIIGKGSMFIPTILARCTIIPV